MLPIVAWWAETGLPSPPARVPISRQAPRRSRMVSVPTKRVFDLIIVSGVLLIPAFGLLRMAAKRWVSESTAIKGEVGQAVQLVIGK